MQRLKPETGTARMLPFFDAPLIAFILFFMKLLLSLLLLLSSSNAFSQTTNPPRSQTSVSIPLKQARTIATSLQQFETLKPLAIGLSLENKSLRLSNEHYKQAIIAKDTALATSARTIDSYKVLYQDRINKEDYQKKRARRNGIKFIALVVLNVVAGAVYVLAK